MYLPTNGAVNSQIRAQTIVEYPHNRFFSAETNSVVDVVRIESVVEIAIFAVIEVTIKSTTRSFGVTKEVKKH